MSRTKTKNLTQEAEKAEKAQACDCWSQMRENLAKEGFKFSRASKLCMSHDLRMVRQEFGASIERNDGKRKRAKDPDFIFFSHCPWCGAPTERTLTNREHERILKRGDGEAAED